MEDGAEMRVLPLFPSSILYLPSSIQLEFPMLPTFQPRKPFHRRGRERSAEQSPVPGSVTVVSVTVLDPETVLWVFSATVASTGINCPPLEATNAGGGTYRAPDYISGAGPSEVVAVYVEANIGAGSLWRVITAIDPGDVSFAGGATLLIPEAGTAAV